MRFRLRFVPAIFCQRFTGQDFEASGSVSAIVGSRLVGLTLKRRDLRFLAAAVTISAPRAPAIVVLLSARWCNRLPFGFGCLRQCRADFGSRCFGSGLGMNRNRSRQWMLELDFRYFTLVNVTDDPLRTMPFDIKRNEVVVLEDGEVGLLRGR